MLILGAVLITAGITNAQITNKGNFIIGGTMGFSAANSDVEQTLNGETISERAEASQINVAPSLGYFFADNFALGFGMDYTLNTVRQPDGRSIDSDLLFGPFGRYYFPAGTDKAFFIETNFGFGSSIDEAELNGTSQAVNTNVFAVGVGPGFTIYSSDAIGIEALVKYNHARSNSSTTVENASVNTITLTNQVDFSVGLQVYLSRLQRANQ